MSAYLVMRMEIVRGIPRFRSLQIMSQPADQCAHHSENDIFIDVYYRKGNSSYNDEYDRIKKDVMNLPSLAWCRQYICLTSNDAHILCSRIMEEENNPLNVALEKMGELP